MTTTNHGGGVPLPVRLRYDHLLRGQCPKCGPGVLLEGTLLGDGDYEDYRWRCRECRYTWTVEGADA